MNTNHATLCSSPEWAEHLQTETLPLVTTGVELGREMLEIGPGPGAATDWLRHRVGRLTALEIDPDAAERLARRIPATNVEVRVGDATELPFADGTFDSVGCFTMLHHVPTVALQNAIFAQIYRVLRPGGVLVGSDSVASNALHAFHEEDTYNPVEPTSLLIRLQTMGFSTVTITVDHGLRFVARKPAAPPVAPPGWDRS